MNNLDKLKILKKIRPDKEWALLAMAEIMKTEIAPQSTLLQKVKFFVSIHSDVFKTVAISATTVVLIVGFGFIGQVGQRGTIIDRGAQAEINLILTEMESINSAIRVEIDNDRISEQNTELMALLDQRHINRLKLQSTISKEIGDIKIRHQEKLTDQNIELLLLAQRANQVEDFYLASFVLNNIRK